MKKINYAVLLVITAATLAFTISDVRDTKYAIGFTLWSIVPWLYAFGLVYVVNHVKKLKFILIITLALGLFGIWAFIDTLYIHLDPQGGLVFLFLPLWQLLAFLFATSLLLFFKRPKDI